MQIWGGTFFYIGFSMENPFFLSFSLSFTLSSRSFTSASIVSSSSSPCFLLENKSETRAISAITLMRYICRRRRKIRWNRIEQRHKRPFDVFSHCQIIMIRRVSVCTSAFCYVDSINKCTEEKKCFLFETSDISVD